MQHPSHKSVEEILKAIQKVIETDNRETASAQRLRRENDGVMLNGSAAAGSIDEAPEDDFLLADQYFAQDDEADILDLGAAATQMMDEEAQSESAPSSQPVSTGKIAPERIIAQIEETLTSERAAEAMRRSLSNLSRISDAAQPANATNGETTIEQLVRDMLRPLLAQWLDANLPPLVEKLVRDEISRIASTRS